MSNADNDVSVPYEEVYKGYEIYIEKNPDSCREDLDWTVCKEGVILDEGSEYISNNALKEACLAIDSLVSTE